MSTTPTPTDESDKADFAGAEQFLVGLSPQYWAHTPLLIGDLCNLGLVDGVDCLISKSHGLESGDETDRHNKRPKTSGAILDTKYVHAKLLPLSKCHIEGVVVNVERKSNGSLLYLVDDGTGMIDCIAWADDDLYSLPPLLEQNSTFGELASYTKFKVGDMVRVMGKIRSVCVGKVQEKVLVKGKVFEVRKCVRELQVNLMEHLTRDGERTSSQSLDLASKHWLDCLMFRKKAALTDPEGLIGTYAAKNDSENNDTPSASDVEKQYDEPIRNGAEVLELLGPEVLSSVMNRSDFPGADDDVGAWKLFGAGCQCELPYKESLLYCHCQASTEALDPLFVFRDALLALLLEMERNVPPNDTDAGIDDLGWQDLQLRFQYKTVLHNKQLASVAEQVASRTGNPAANTRRLYICTFRALRKDGILHLIDSDSDTYLLVSRERVLEPYMRQISSKDAAAALERRLLRAERPACLTNVPGARLQYVKKSLKSKDNK